MSKANAKTLRASPESRSDEEEFSKIRPPFVYVGGKTKMLPYIRNNTPAQFGNYFEPFLGGGAVAIDMMKKYPEKTYFLSDYNQEVVITWKAVRDFPEQIISELSEHSDRHEERYFLSVRDWDRNLLLQYKAPFERAARMIYLCSVSFGGGYRVGADGYSKNSFGRDTYNPQSRNLRLVSELLRSRKIAFYERDFNESEVQLRGGDFIYLDPPYATDVEGESYSISDDYGKSVDTQAITRQVRRLMEVATEHGAYALMSNTSTPTTEDLWEGWHSITRDVVWTAGSPAKDGTRKVNKERLWANIHLFRSLSTSGRTVQLLEGNSPELLKLALVDNEMFENAIHEISGIATRLGASGGTEQELAVAQSLKSLVAKSIPDTTRSAPTTP